MGNLNCSRCVEDFEFRLETNLDPVAILQAYNTLNETEFNSLAATCEIDFTSNQKQGDKISAIQRQWKIHLAKKRKGRLKTTCLKTAYFSHIDVLSTLNKGYFKNLRKRAHFTYDNGAFYEGDARGGFRDGYGKMKWADLCSYEGNWSFGYPFGYGKFIYLDKEPYEGKWSNPFPCGTQSITSSTQSFELNVNTSDGYIWLWFKHEGSHSMYLSQQKKLESLTKVYMSVLRLLEDGRKNLYDYKEISAKNQEFELDKGKYCGEMVDGKRHGVGEQNWGVGFFYLGQWANNMQNGFGKSHWADGSAYIGYFRNSSKEGVGEYSWADGNAFIGEWNEDLMQGIGKYIYADGREYFGQWNKGQMDGLGVFKWKDGRKYEGLWKNGKKHGQGCTFDLQGNPVFNQWTMGKIYE